MFNGIPAANHGRRESRLWHWLLLTIHPSCAIDGGGGGSSPAFDGLFVFCATHQEEGLLSKRICLWLGMIGMIGGEVLGIGIRVGNHS